MIGITGIAIDEQNNLIQGNKIAVVKLYQSKTAGEEVYEETIRDVVVKNGFFSIPLGLTNDVASVVRANPVLFYDVIIDGRSVYDGDFQPLTSSPYAISTGYNFYGIGSPVSTVTAPVGASYVDTRDRELYIKTVTGDGDWVKVGN